MSTRRGRPSGYTLNPDSFRGFLAGRSQAAIAAQAGITPSHLSEMLAGIKGATEDVADRLTAAVQLAGGGPLGPGAIFPERATFRVQIREFTVAGAA